MLITSSGWTCDFKHWFSISTPAHPGNQFVERYHYICDCSRDWYLVDPKQCIVISLYYICGMSCVVSSDFETYVWGNPQVEKIRGYILRHFCLHMIYLLRGYVMSRWRWSQPPQNGSVYHRLQNYETVCILCNFSYEIIRYLIIIIISPSLNHFS